MSRIFPVILLAACNLGGSEPAEAPAAPVAEAVAPSAEQALEAMANDEATKALEEAFGKPWETFGTPYVISEVVGASTLLDGPDGYVGKALTVEGEVADVCQKAGCWMVVTDGADRSIRVRMKDHAFEVAKDCTGAKARVHGEVVALEVKADEVEHFAGEAAKPEVAPEKDMEAGATTYELVATAVQIQR